MGLICAAAFTLTNCTKDLEPQAPVKEGVPFEITASINDTKTTNDGLNTSWVKGDAISVFHTEANSKAYGTNDAFTCTSISENSFSGTLTKGLEEGKSYDWYAIYNYYEGYTTPAASSDADGGAIYIGYRPGITQSGLNSTAHLKGSSCTMYGVAKNIASDSPVKVDMKHLTSVVKINVTNNSGADLDVSSISFTAEEDIVGSFYIDITGDTPVYVPKSGSVSKVATLKANGKTTLTDGQSGAFYIPIKPFKAAAGEKLTISVNGNSKEKTLTKDVSFVAGKIHALNFDYIKFPEISVSSGSIDVAKEGGDKSFTYTITNSIAGKKIKAVASDTWINNFDYSIDGTVSFKVDANEGGARTGKITLSYEYANDVEVSVEQAGAIAYDYKLVESALSDWRGDYLIAYSSTVFMDGSLPGGKSTGQVGGSGAKANPGTALSADGKTISEEWGNKHYFTIEAISDDDLSKGYVLKTHSTTNPYIYVTSTKSGLEGTATKSTAAKYPIFITFKASNDVLIVLSGNADGMALRYNTSGFFRYYSKATQNPIYLYKKAN